MDDSNIGDFLTNFEISFIIEREIIVGFYEDNAFKYDLEFFSKY